jgi:biopolymer transport protein ExbD
MRRTVRVVLVAAAIFLLGLRISKTRHSGSEGFYVMLPAHTASQIECENRTVVLQVLKDRSLKVNFEAISNTDLRRRLGEIYRLRQERVLFLTAEPDVSFQEVVRVIEKADGAAANLYIALLTPKSKNESCWFIDLQRRPQKLPEPR